LTKTSAGFSSTTTFPAALRSTHRLPLPDSDGWGAAPLVRRVNTSAFTQRVATVAGPARAARPCRPIAPVPDDADAQTQLLTFLGRQVRVLGATAAGRPAAPAAQGW